MRENGFKEWNIEWESKYGLMVVSIMANGNKTKPMVVGLSIIQMVMFMMENGPTIKPMDKGNIHILMELSILENGKMISNMDMELNNG